MRRAPTPTTAAEFRDANPDLAAAGRRRRCGLRPGALGRLGLDAAAIGSESGARHRGARRVRVDRTLDEEAGLDRPRADEQQHRARWRRRESHTRTTIFRYTPRIAALKSSKNSAQLGRFV